MILNRRIRRTLWALSLCLYTAAFATPQAFGDDPAAQLEKAIYLEETVGNLDEAIAGYEKVIADGEQSINAGAEAQFRIASCLAKQGKAKEANAAFQSVIDGYGKATEWVTRAKGRLAEANKLLPVPWGDGDEMRMEMKLASGLTAGYQVFRVAKVTQDGRDYWECHGGQGTPLNGGSRGYSRVLADYETFAPIESAWDHSLIGSAKAKYQDNEITIQLKNKEEPIELDLDQQDYDNEQAAQVFRRLPLGVGYESTISVISSLTGTKVPIGLSVPKTKTIKVPAGEFECFQLELAIGQTFYVSNDEHRYIVRFEAGGITADLVEVRPASTGPKKIEHELFEVTLPGTWYSCESEESDSDKTTVHLFTPNVETYARFEAGPMNKSQNKHKTPKAWLEHRAKQNGKNLKDFKLIEIVELEEIANVAEGKPAVGRFEYSGKDKKMIGLRWMFFGKKGAVDLRVDLSADQLSAEEAELEKLAASIKLK